MSLDERDFFLATFGRLLVDCSKGWRGMTFLRSLLMSSSDVFLMKVSSVFQGVSDISKSQIFTYMRQCRAVTVCEFSECRQYCKTEEIVFQLDALTTAVIKS